MDTKAVYQAFEPVLLLDKLPVKVESIANYRQNLYIGTSTGVLLVYKISRLTSNGSLAYVDEFGEKYEVSLYKSIKNFAKKPIESLEVMPELGLLLAVYDYQVNAHDLATFEFHTSLAPLHLASQAASYRTPLQIASITGIEPLKSLNSEAEPLPTMTTRLCIAGRRTLTMLMWVDSEFAAERTQEFTIPDKVKKLEFLTSTRLWLGLTSKEYFILDLATSQLTEVLPNHHHKTPPTSTSKATSPIPDEVGTVSSTKGLSSLISDLAFSSTQYVQSYNPLSSSKLFKPILLKVNQEMIVVKDEVGLFVGSDGLPSRKQALHFSIEPLFLSYSYPYLLVVNSKQVEIRNLDSQALIQVFPLNTNLAIAITLGKSPFLATNHQVYRMVPSHFADQINQLIQLKLFEEALTLLEQNKDRVSHVKVQSSEQIKHLYGLELFKQNQFDRALTLFYEIKLQPIQVITLFPKPVSPSNFSSPKSSQANESKEDTSNKESKWDKGRLDEAVQSLVKYLTQYRTKLVGKIPQADPSQSEPTSPTSTHIEVDEEVHNAILIDTTLVQCYLIVNPSMVGPLLRIRNFVDVYVCDQILTQHKRYRNLVDLYYSKGLHRKALQLLMKLGNRSDPEFKENEVPKGFEGPSQTLQYLAKLGGDQFDLIDEFATWCLEYDRATTMDLFLEEQTHSATWPTVSIVNLLERCNKELALQYLKHTIAPNYILDPPKFQVGHLTTDLPDIHTRMTTLLIEKALDKLEMVYNLTTELLDVDDQEPKLEFYQVTLALETFNPNDATRKRMELIEAKHYREVIDQYLELYRSLVYFLNGEPHLYKAERILTRLPSDVLFKPRAIVLSRMERHDQALQLLVYRLQDFNFAQDYCVKVDSDQVFQQLLQIYLKVESMSDATTPTSHSQLSSPTAIPITTTNLSPRTEALDDQLASPYLPYLTPALVLLGKFGNRFDASAVLQLLPTTVQFQPLIHFFQSNLGNLAYTQRIHHLKSYLLKGEKLRLQLKLAKLQAKPIFVESSTLCPTCLKRLGTSALAIFPDRRVVHYSCQNKSLR